MCALETLQCLKQKHALSGRNLNVYMYTCIHHTLHTKHTPRHKAQYELNPSLIQLGVIISHNGKQKL